MKKSFFGLMAVGSLLMSGHTSSAQSNSKTEVEKVVQGYFKALNASDGAKVVTFFTADGVLLPSAAPTAEGTEQLKGNYQYVFDNYTFDLKVNVGTVTVQGNHAFVRSTSKGTLGIKANGQKIEAEFRELFVLQKVKGSWKIATYMYNQSK